MTPAPATRTLPLDAHALSLLDALRSAPDAAPAAAALLDVLPARPAPGRAYALRRLALGAAASAGRARANMPLALAAAAAQPGGLAGAAEAVLGVYGEEGDFEGGYTGAERERAIGGLASVSAVAAAACGGGEGAELGPEQAKALLWVLRDAAAAAGGRWGLGAGCGRVARDVVRAAGKDAFKSDLEKGVMRWVRERRESVDGVVLALALYVDLRFIDGPVFASVYPKMDVFKAALMDCFETGFPLWGKVGAAADGAMPEVPLQWALAVRLSAMPTAAAAAACGGAGVSAFWTSLVLPSLASRSAAGPEKKTLLLALFPAALRACGGAADAGALLTDPLARFLAATLPGRHAARRGKAGGARGERLAAATAALGSTLLDAVRTRQREGVRDAGAWVRGLLVWAVRHRVATRLFRGDTLRAAAALMAPRDVDGLFREVVGVVAAPPSRTDREASATRADAVHFLANLSAFQPAIAPDVLKVLALFSCFDFTGEADAVEVGKAAVAASGVGKKKGKKQKSPMKSEIGPEGHGEVAGGVEIKAMYRHVVSGKKNDLVIGKEAEGVGDSLTAFGGLLPKPSPEIEPATAEMMFRQLADLVSLGRAQATDRVSGNSKAPVVTALTFIEGVAATKQARKVDLRSTNLHLKSDLDELAKDVAALPPNLLILPVVRSILVLTQFMTLYLYDPMMMESEGDAAVSPATYARVLSLLGPCLQAVKDEANGLSPPAAKPNFNVGDKKTQFKKVAKANNAKQQKTEESRSESESGNDDDENSRPPTSLEQIVYILVTVCRQHSATLRHIAASAFEVIASVADESVTAVIFDLLEADDAEVQEALKKAAEEEDDDDEEEGLMEMDLGMDSGSEDDSEDDSDSGDDEDEGACKEVTKKGMGKDKDATIVDNVMATKPDAEDGSDEDSDEGDLTNIMLDDEDPATLEAYDKHLSNHMKLLKVEKKKNKRARQKSVRLASSAARLLDIVELLARRLRLRLETGEKSSGGVLFTFLDLLARLAEFGYGRDVNGAPHLDRLVTIFCKHMDRPISSFGEERVTAAEAQGLLLRWFGALSTADHRRTTGVPERRMLARGSSIISCCVPQTKDVQKRILEAYGDLWEQYKSPGNRFLCMTVFTTAGARLPALVSELSGLAVGTAQDANASSGTRVLALQALHFYSAIVREHADAGGKSMTGTKNATDAMSVVAAFWASIFDILSRACNDKDSAQALWKHGSGVTELLRIVETGLQGGEFGSKSKQVGNHVSKLLASLTLPRVTEGRMRKLVRSVIALSATGPSSIVDEDSQKDLAKSLKKKRISNDDDTPLSEKKGSGLKKKKKRKTVA